jgi:peptidoglycan-associated lipoprotein
MLRKLSFLTAALLVLSLATSCHKKTKTDEAVINEKPVEIIDNMNNSNSDSGSSYQTVDNAKQAEALNQQPQVQEIEVQDRVLFGYDSSELTADAKKILDTQVSWLKSDPAIKVTVEGHCDERGTREYNIALGEKRANAAKNYLIANGISESRLKVVSYGKEHPAFFGEGEEVMSKNRRAVTVMN